MFPGSSYARSSVVTAVKFTISDQPQPIDPLLKNCIGNPHTNPNDLSFFGPFWVLLVLVFVYTVVPELLFLFFSVMG